MSAGDQATGLPVRSEADGVDERVHSKIVGSPTGVNPATNQAAVDNDKNVHVEVHGNEPAGTDKVLRLSELGAVTPDGVYHAANNSKPGNEGVIVHTRAVTPGDADQNIRATGINSTVNTNVWAQDVAIRDEQGNPFTAANPLPVTNVDSEGTEVNDYFPSAATIAAGATDTHIYTVTALKTLKLTQISASASGKMRIDIEIETGVATGVYTVKFTLFNSAAEPNIHQPVKEAIAVAAGVRVRITRENRDNQTMKMFSTISGHEI